MHRVGAAGLIVARIVDQGIVVGFREFVSRQAKIGTRLPPTVLCANRVGCNTLGNLGAGTYGTDRSSRLSPSQSP